jgi:hypothetical protein
MKMPNNDQSEVAEEKISEYLLSRTHEQGKHKADFFSRFGFDLNNAVDFKAALLQHSIDRDVETEKESPYGNKYELKCEFKTPDERNPCIYSVWIIENGKEAPKLITAYPA